jgi:hypothetical protein
MDKINLDSFNKMPESEWSHLVNLKAFTKTKESDTIQAGFASYLDMFPWWLLPNKVGT